MEQIAYVAKKVKGNSGALDNHISRTRWDEERQTMVTDLPESVSHPERTALNKDYILRDGESREDAVRARIEAAGVARAIRANQVTSLDIIATANHEAMQRIEQAGQLDAWAADCIEATRAIFGRENVVAAMLHMDEHTPHLHIAVVPIVQGAAKPRPATRKESEARDGRPKRRYKRQETAARLCARDVMTRENMRMWQDTIAAHVVKYELERGERGSKAKHQDPAEYRKSLDDRDRELTRREQAIAEKEQRINQASGKAKEIGAAAIEGLHNLLQPGKAKEERAAEVAAARDDERAKVIREVQQAAGLTLPDATAQDIGKSWGSWYSTAGQRAKDLKAAAAAIDGLKAEVKAAKEDAKGWEELWYDTHTERVDALAKVKEQEQELDAWRSGLLKRALDAIARYVKSLVYRLNPKERDDIARASAKITPHGLFLLATAQLPTEEAKRAERAISEAIQGENGQKREKINQNNTNQQATTMEQNKLLSDLMQYARDYARGKKGEPWVRGAFNDYFTWHEEQVEAGRAMSFGGQSGSTHNREVMAEKVYLELRDTLDDGEAKRLRDTLRSIAQDPRQSRGLSL